MSTQDTYAEAARILAPSIVTGQNHGDLVSDLSRRLRIYSESYGISNESPQVIARHYSRQLSLWIASKNS